MCNLTPKFKGTEWSFDSIDEIWEEVKSVSKKYKWEGFPVIFEIVSAEQMLNNYTSHGLPIMYEHWSFGKNFLQHKESYDSGKSGLAYELIINSNPSLCYLMETNTQLMQILTISHAAVGHNHFFKHNYMFKQWTKPAAIHDFLSISKKYIQECELKYGYLEVETLLDIAHGMAFLSVNKALPNILTKEQKKIKKANRLNDLLTEYDPVIHGDYDVYKNKKNNTSDPAFTLGKTDIHNPHTSLISCLIEGGGADKWKNKILSIVQSTAQYFYPQILTKVMNEGFASFVHYTIVNDLYEKGLIPEGYVLEFIDSHSAVVNQYPFDGKRLAYINPYYLGFNMFMDIKRMCVSPTEEDIEFCPGICNTDWLTTINSIVENYRDDSFIQQFLSPFLIRKLKLVELFTLEGQDYLSVVETHDLEGYNKLRETLVKQHEWVDYFPDGQYTIYDNILYMIFEIKHNNTVNRHKLLQMCYYINGILWNGRISIWLKQGDRYKSLEDIL
jgi:stage V sporulation protein R